MCLQIIRSANDSSRRLRFHGFVSGKLSTRKPHRGSSEVLRISNAQSSVMRKSRNKMKIATTTKSAAIKNRISSKGRIWRWKLLFEKRSISGGSTWQRKRNRLRKCRLGNFGSAVKTTMLISEDVYDFTIAQFIITYSFTSFHFAHHRARLPNRYIRIEK